MEKLRVSSKNEIKTELFESFKVHRIINSYAFFHIEIEDSPIFYEKMFNYFFNEDKLLKYCEHTTAIKFKPSQLHYAILFRHLKTYIDEENQEKDVSELDEVLLAILHDEMKLYDKKGKKIVRNDKIGKIGEYLFCCLLSDYFHFDCILPKVHLQTDFNMNVYGIDTLYYSEQNNLLLFGESKVCLNLDNGIQLINTSLKEYEQQLENEFYAVLSNRLYKDKLHKFNDLYGEIAEICLDIKTFIKKANIKEIGIPIFIAHGSEIVNSIIFKKLKKIKLQNFLGLKTRYYIISLPIVNKDKMIATFTKMIKEKEDYYESVAR